MSPVCPDCGATAPERVDLEHDPTCPLGMAIEEVAEGDRAWFEAHPDEDVYHRPITCAEVSEWIMWGEPDVRFCTHMAIWRVAPGARWRQPFEATAGAP